MTLVNVKALALLARLEVTEEELARLERELPDILGFVEQIQKASADVPVVEPALKNVMREDEHPHESGVYTQDLLSAAPVQKENQIVVKQVISRKK